MTVLSQDRAGRGEKSWRIKQFVLLSGTIAYALGAAFLTATGKVVPAQNALALFFIGQFTRKVDASAADTVCEVDLLREVSLFRYPNATAGDAVQATDVGKFAFFLDDQTVQITPNAKLAGRVWEATANYVLVEHFEASPGDAGMVGVLPAYAANDSIPTSLVNGAAYDVPVTAAASTITLPAAAPDGTSVHFAADGTKNAHTVTYRDATGPTALTTALVASKRHLVVATKVAGKWVANAYVSP